MLELRCYVIHVIYLTFSSCVFILSNINTDIVTNDGNVVHSSILLEESDFKMRLQDRGCAQSELPKKRYKQAKILSVGPDKHAKFYYGLTSIAIDYVKIMQQEKAAHRGWSKIPKNATNIKMKIVEIILSQRTEESYGTFTLCQDRLARNLFSVWGSSSSGQAMHYNDKLRLFGLIMTIPENRPIFQRLAEGASTRATLDDPSLSLSAIYQKLAFDFNNEDIIVQLPDNSEDIEGIQDLDPNDMNRILIRRESKFF